VRTSRKSRKALIERSGVQWNKELIGKRRLFNSCRFSSENGKAIEFNFAEEATQRRGKLILQAKQSCAEF